MTGFVNGAQVGLASGMASGFIQNTGNSLLEGADFGGALESGIMGAIMGGASGGLVEEYPAVSAHEYKERTFGREKHLHKHTHLPRQILYYIGKMLLQSLHHQLIHRKRCIPDIMV